jgi:hypothetical protein
MMVCVVQYRRFVIRNDESNEGKLQMRRLIRIAVVGAMLMGQSIAQSAAGNPAAEVEKFFHAFVGLNDDQIRDIRAGRALAKVLQSPTPDEVFVFGAVYINSSPERYLKLAGDIDALRKLPSFIALQKFSNPPQIADLDGFVLDEKDLNELQHCKRDHCEVQLPTEAMEEFQRSVDWSAPDRAEQANRLAQQMALQALLRYQQGGNTALGTYRDKSRPTAVAETFASLLSELKALPVYLPELQRYLLEYPNAASNEIRSDFYWEKVNFGLKPTLRIIQAIVYQGASSDRPAYAVALKQLYASHYFETALDLTLCVRDSVQERNGFYLITIKGSQQAGLTGLKGGIVRKVAVDKTRSSLQKVLAAYKQHLETNRE